MFIFIYLFYYTMRREKKMKLITNNSNLNNNSLWTAQRRTAAATNTLSQLESQRQPRCLLVLVCTHMAAKTPSRDLANKAPTNNKLV
jgi:hypothetical protein